MTRTAHRWQSKPGSFDTLHSAQLFPSGNAYGIPDLQHTPTGRGTSPRPVPGPVRR